MRILIIIPPTSYVNYPIAEAGTYIQALRQAGHECELKEANLSLLDCFLNSHSEEIKTCLGVNQKQHPVFIRTIGDIFEDTNYAYILKQLEQYPQLADDIVSTIINGDFDSVIFVFQWLRTFSNVLPWLASLSNRIANESKASQFLTGLGLRSLPDRILKSFSHDASVQAIILGDEINIAEGLKQHGIWDGGEGNLDIGAPLPDMSDYRIGEYLNPKMGTNVTNLYFSRGCLGGCIFCNERFSHCSYRIRDPRTPAYHMRSLNESYGFEIFRFSDSRLNENEDAFYSMVDYISKERTQKMYWVGMIQGNKPISSQQANKLYQSGCRALWMGVESADKNILRTLRKDTHIDHILTTTKSLREAGILVVTLWIAGGPWETEASVINTMSFMQTVADLGAGVHVSPFRLYEKSSMPQAFKGITTSSASPSRYSVLLPYACPQQDWANKVLELSERLSAYGSSNMFFYDIEGRLLCSEL